MVNIFPVLFRNILFVYFAFAVFFSLSLLVKGLCGVVEPETGTEELRTLHEKAPMRIISGGCMLACLLAVLSVWGGF